MSIGIGKFTLSYEQIGIIDNNQESIVNRWLSSEEMIALLKSYSFELETFKRSYAKNILSDFVDTLLQRRLNNNFFIIFLKDMNVAGSTDIFSIYSYFQNAIFDELFAQNIMTHELHKSLTAVLNYQYKDILENQLQQCSIQKCRRVLEANESKENFLANISHEMRTPLNSILGLTQILKKRLKEEEQLNYLNIILDSGESLLHMVNDILDMEKLKHGKLSLNIDKFNLIEQMQLAVEQSITAAANKDITLYSYIQPSMPCEAVGDPIRIKQSIANILDNAVKFTPKGGKVAISITFRDSVLKIRIKDNGIGISRLQLGTIFDLFSQGQGSISRSYEGLGMGLTISSHLVKIMEGEINVNSKVGKGSTFYMDIPLKIENDKICTYNDLNLSIGIHEESSLINNGKLFSTYVNIMYPDNVKIIYDISTCKDDILVIDENTATIELLDKIKTLDIKKLIILASKEPNNELKLDNKTTILMQPITPQKIVNILKI